jgi:predicted  nucleic acid-binding Zn-ribbon protein
MSSSEPLGDGLVVHVENVGGIDESTVELSAGVTALVGRNATNRTSLLRAIAGALGGDHATLKGDADRGEVRLSVDGETHTRVLERRDGTVRAGGDPYREDPGAADLFGFLFESNPARTAVRRGDDLRDLIVRPVDTDEIEREIRTLVDERDAIDDDLRKIESLADDLPDLEAERASLAEEVTTLDEEVDRLRDRIDEAEGDAASAAATDDELEAAREDLRAARERLADARDDRETEREALASLREERTDLRAALEDHDPVSEARVETLEDRLDDLRARKRSLESTLTGLQRVVQFNERVLDGDLSDVVDPIDDPGDPTEELLAGGRSVTCWTCGTEVEAETVRETIARLSTLRREIAEEGTDVAETIEAVSEERDDLVARREERAEVERRLADVESEIERREDRVAACEERIAEAERAVERLSDRVERLRADRQDERLALQTELGDRRYERDRARERLSEVETRIESVEEELARREDLREERAAVVDRVETLRTRVERLETAAVESFNDHMAELLDRLDYENVERVWLERADEEFGLHVVRTTAEGVAYEDTVDHLSESEREVIGLVFALAGYLVHDVHETVPVMLVDSVEAIDGPRVAALLGYLGERVPYVVAALLPEHAAALPGDVDRVTTV